MFFEDPLYLVYHNMIQIKFNACSSSFYQQCDIYHHCVWARYLVLLILVVEILITVFLSLSNLKWLFVMSCALCLQSTYTPIGIIQLIPFNFIIIWIVQKLINNWNVKVILLVKILILYLFFFQNKYYICFFLSDLMVWDWGIGTVEKHELSKL